MPLPDDDPRVRINKCSYVVYEHADLSKVEQFLLDFGMTVVEESSSNDQIFFKGYGRDPFLYWAKQSTTPGKSRFGGAAYLVESRAELEKASAINGASPIGRLNAPGGGEIVTLRDPAGHPVHLVYGQQPVPKETLNLPKLMINYEDEKPRRGQFQRFEPGPAPVHKWGHYGVTYPAGTYKDMYNWYTKHLALAPSDIISNPSTNEPMTCFFHVDRGTSFTDHHAFFFKPSKPGDLPSIAHAAFEVHDFDVQHLGHDWLAQKGYELCWGVGRHVLGSQVFDYWFDPSGFMLEHYADGDLVNCETPVGKEVARPGMLAVWGPPVPSVF